MSAAGTATRCASELRAICGTGYVVEDPGELQRYAISGVVPGIAVTPASAEEIAAIVRVANEQGLNVVPAGGCTELSAGTPPDTVDLLLLTSRLTAVEHYDHADLTVGVGAGVTVQQLSAMLAADRLIFAVDPPQPERRTIGGVLATAAHGPLRHGYGAARDFCIGIRFVTGDGRRAKAGGRVVKNVAGYDLMKLLIGSWGTLGVITSASFKLFPAPRQTRTFLCEFAGPREALAFRDVVLRSPLSPICLELVSPSARNLMRPDAAGSSAWVVCVRAAGSDSVLKRYASELGSAVTREVQGEKETELWTTLENFIATPQAQGPESVVLYLAVAPREVTALIDPLLTIPAESGVDTSLIGRFGVGHLLALWRPAPEGPQTVDYAKMISRLAASLPTGSSLAVLRCPPRWRRQIPAWVKTPAPLQHMNAVKQALDPRGVLNRGRFGL